MENKKYNTALALCFIILSIIFVFRECNRSQKSTNPLLKPVKTHNKTTGDTWRRVANDWKKVASMNTGKISEAITIQKFYYTTNYPLLPDTCKTFVERNERNHAITDSLLLFQINTQDKVIAAQDSANKQYRKQISVDSMAIENRDRIIVDTVKYKDRQIRRRGFKRLMQGMGIGAAIGVGLGSQIKN